MPAGTLGLRASGELTKEDYVEWLEPALREGVDSGELPVFGFGELEEAKRVGLVREVLERSGSAVCLYPSTRAAVAAARNTDGQRI